MKLKTAEEKLTLILKVYGFSFLAFISIYLPFLSQLHSHYRLIYLAAIIPITMSIGSGILCKIRVGPIFLLYVTSFSTLHFFMFRGQLAYSEIVWILCWVILPSFSTWGIVMSTWTAHPSQMKAMHKPKVPQPKVHQVTTLYALEDLPVEEDFYQEEVMEQDYEVDYVTYMEREM